MLTASIICTFLALPSALANPLTRRWDDFSVKHAWAEVPAGWIDHSDPPADHTLALRIGLKQDRFAELVDHLYQVSDPSHARYGSHLSKGEVDTLVAPHPDTLAAVEEWLAYHGIDVASIGRSSAGDWLALSVPVSQAERMLDAKYRVYHNPSTGEYKVRTTAYALPRILHEHVAVVAPTTYFGGMKQMRATSHLQPNAPTISDEEATAQIQSIKQSSNAAVPASCERTITPACLQALYNTTGYTPQAADVNKIGVSGYLGEFANDADLQTFFDKFLPAAAGTGTTITHVEVNGGGNDQTVPGVEANLDVQYTEGMSFPTPNIYFSTGGEPPFIPDSETPTNTNEPYLDWLNFILNQTSNPQTFSTSYGDDEQTVPKDFAITVCNMFAQLGVQGSSVVFSSGDFGVGGGSCLTNNGTNKVVFQPIFPASCPFVTSTGATTLINPEVAASFSSGGFSNFFLRPSYQAAAVQKFLNGLGSQFSGLFNATGRGFPDVAAQGENFQIILGGSTVSVAGTSASAPTFAGIVALLNDFRISIGKAPLGFLNPLLYTSGVAGLNDITSGSNPGCGTNGFTATAGWDPVTGLGTPDFGNLQAIVGSLP